MWDDFVCNDVYFLQSNKAFKRIDIDKKKEEIDKMKTKYGINAEEKKWNGGESYYFDELGTKRNTCFTRIAFIFIFLFSLSNFIKKDRAEWEYNCMRLKL